MTLLTSNKPKTITGKILYLNMDLKKGGWGFIVSETIPFTRIFFHWTGLNQNTKKFSELNKGDELKFEVMDIPDKGLRAIKIEAL
jgi:cold shock CspA family protein